MGHGLWGADLMLAASRLVTVRSMNVASRTRAWDTSRVAGPARPCYWSVALGEALLPLEVSTPVGDAFGGRVLRLDLGALALVQLESAPFQAAWAEPVPGAPLLLLCQAGQPWELRQSGQLRHLRPGDVVMAGGMRPFQAHFPQGCHLLAVVVPRASAARWLRDPDAVVGRVGWREQAWVRTLSALCLQLVEDPQSALALPVGRLDDLLGSLLSASFEPGSADEDLGRRTGLVERAIALMQRQLDQRGLAANDLARDLNVSVRSLQRAFSAQGRSVAVDLRALRMQRAVQLLADPVLRELPIAEIGSRCGFGDASHFTREFRRAWHETPAQWRARAARAGGDDRQPAQPVDAAVRHGPPRGHNPAP